MCGRFVVTVPDLNELAAEFSAVADTSLPWQPHFNLAPTQLAPVITNEPERALRQMRFGLMPFWAKTGSGKRGSSASMINARVETIATKPAYRKALLERRCVIPVSGYYEWQKTFGKKQPVYIHAADGRMLALSGVWEHWTTREGEVIESFAIVTRASTGFLADIHDRMPLELPEAALATWLDPAPKSAEQLAPVLGADVGATQLVAHPVSMLVNSVHNDAAELLAEIQPEPPPQLELFAGALEPKRTPGPARAAKKPR